MQKLAYSSRQRTQTVTRSPENLLFTHHLPFKCTFLPRNQNNSTPARPKYTTSPYRNPINFIQQQKLLKYTHSRHITEQISSTKSEDEQDKNIALIKHRRDLTTNISNIKYIRNMENNCGDLFETTKIKINDSKFMKQNINNKENEWKVHNHQKHFRSDSSQITPPQTKNNTQHSYELNEIKEIDKNICGNLRNSQNGKNNQSNLNQKCRFRILSSDSKDMNQLCNDRFKLEFKSHNNQLKVKTDNSWTKNFMKKQSRLGTHHGRFYLPENKVKNKTKCYEKERKNVNPTNTKNNQQKHIRHNTQISTSAQKQQLRQTVGSTNFNQIASTIKDSSNYNYISYHPNLINYKKPANKEILQSLRIQQQCSVVYENDSQVEICLKTLQKTKLQMNENKQKSVNISFLDQDIQIQTSTHTPLISFRLPKLSDQYKKGKFLGKGYFGQVYLGLHIPTGIICALKYLDIKRLVKQDMLESIRRQIECQIALSHPNICKIYQYFIDEEVQALVLAIEFIEGEQLYKSMKNKRRYNQQETADIIYQIASALEYMHKKHIIHRDIKPQNIMITHGIAKICDFGWAVLTTSSRKTICGTPLYTSPQIVLGKQYDKRIDLWALGVLTYEMLVGSTPFKIYGQHQLIKIAEDEIKFPQYVDISSKAKDFITRLLNKNPEQRMDIFEILDHPFIRRRKRALQRVSISYPDFLKVLFDEFQ